MGDEAGVKNASSLPKIYYGLHFAEGVAEYHPANEPMHRLLITNDVAKQMDATFPGRPVYVRHVDKVNLAELETEAAGYVTESFYNPADGKHWAKFIVISDAGHKAIANGWKLSNAYVPRTTGPGGEWHGVGYQKEVLSGEYTHLALVPDPRYAESMILTPEEFKNYNAEKEIALKAVANSKSDGTKKGLASMLSFFRKSKVESADEIANITVTIKGVDKTIGQLVNEAEKREEDKGMADPDAKVQVGNRTMTVNELREEHTALCAYKQSAEDEKSAAAKKAEEEKAAEEAKNAADKKAAEEKAAKEAADKAAAEAAAKEKQNSKEVFNALASAAARVQAAEMPVGGGLALGKARYSSN